MDVRIALQLYTVRGLLPKDYNGVLRRVASIGYAGVEPAGFPGSTPGEASELFKELGLAVPSVHIFPPPVGKRFKEALELLSILDCRRIVSGFGPERFKTLDETRRACDEFNELSRLASANGLSACIHNHWWEFLPVEGSYPFRVMLERLDPSVQFEVDTYWVKTAGFDPAVVVKELGERASLLHIKDGPAVTGKPMVAVGEGVMDFASILKASAAQWLIVELDECATDVMVAVEKSYQNLSRLVSRGGA